MSEKKPDTPVVHLPWSHYQSILDRLAGLARARAYLEDVMENGRAHASDAAREALDLLYRDAPQAAAPPPAAPYADEVEVVARAMWADMFAPHELPLDAWLQDRYRHTAKCALAALAPLRQAERERAWREGADFARGELAEGLCRYVAPPPKSPHEPKPDAQWLAGAEAMREACKRGVLGGRFLHDDAPTARFARECAAMLDRLPLPPAPGATP